jgi:wolfamin
MARQVQGISYLRKAAEQGHELALELLGACYRTRRGINSSNESEINEFLNLSKSERVARHAAHELFNSLCNGNEYVTVEALEKRMREIYKLQKKKRKPDDTKACESGEISVQEELEEASASSKSSSPLRVHASRRLGHHENHISEANLLRAANNYCQGQLPLVSQALTLSIPHPHSLQHVPYLHRPFFHPAMFFSLLYHRFISIFSNFPSDIFKKFQILIVLAVYALVSTNSNLLISLPTITYYITLMIMVVASFKMLKSKHEFIDFRVWSGLFLSYNENVYADNSENLYLRNNLKPYLWFFIAFATNLMVYPLIADQWLPNSEVTVLSFALTFVTLLCFMTTSSSGLPDLVTLFSFAVNVLAKYPYEMDSIVSGKWRFLDLKIPGIPSFMIGSGIEFSMNCRGMLYFAIVLFLLVLARRRNWHGIYQFLIPHCVTLAWLQISIINSQSATTFGLMRSTLGLAGLLFFLPAFGLVTLLIPVFAAVEWLSVDDSTNKLFITISTSLIAILGSCFMAISNRTGKYVTYVQILLCIIASFFLFRPYVNVSSGNNMYSPSYMQEDKVASSREIDDGEMLTWEAFHKYCLEPDTTNKINLQMRCSHLDKMNIYWDGVVSDVEIARIRNWRKDLLHNYLPDFISNSIICYYGEVNKADCFEGEKCDIKEFIEDHKKCNLDKWNM